MEPLRKLLVLGLNVAVDENKISLASPAGDAPTDETGYFFTNIAGYPSVVLWNSISAGELRVSVWWNYEHSNHPQANSAGNARETFSLAQPLAKRSKYPRFVGATVSGWLERKTGTYLQGERKQGLHKTYLRRDMKVILANLPEPQPHGYAAVGEFFP